MVTLPFDITEAESLLNDALLFINNNTRDTFPIFMNSLGLIPIRLHLNAGTVSYIPNKTATSENQAYAATSCFLAYGYTKNQAWKDKGLQILGALRDRFYIDAIPSNPVDTSPYWVPHHLCVVYDGVPTEGAAYFNTRDDPYYFGNFATMNFTNGIATPSNSNIARVAKIYSGSLLANTLHYPVLTPNSTDMGVAYWVAQGYRNFIGGGVTATNTEAQGTIKANFAINGNYTVALSYFESISTYPTNTAVRDTKGWIGNYPVVYKSRYTSYNNKDIVYIDCTIESLIVAFFAYELAYLYTNDAQWKRAQDATKYSIYRMSAVFPTLNTSYWYKKEDSADQPLRYPGSRITQTNGNINKTVTYNPTGYTVVREVSAGKVNWLKILVSGTTDTTQYPSISFDNVFTEFVWNTRDQTIYLESALGNGSGTLEVRLYTSKDSSDTTKQYVFYFEGTGDGIERPRNIKAYEFFNWEVNNTVWHPLIYPTSYSASTSNGGTITQAIRESVIYLYNEYFAGMILYINCNTGTANGGNASITIQSNNGAKFTKQIPSIVYSSYADYYVDIVAGNNNLYRFILPYTNGAWSTFSMTWQRLFNRNVDFYPSDLPIVSMTFSPKPTNYPSALSIHYLGNSPKKLPLPSTVYRLSFTDKIRGGHTFWIGDIKPTSNPRDTLPYQLGAFPYNFVLKKNITDNTVTELARRTAVYYLGLQFPTFWDKVNLPERRERVIDLIYAGVEYYRTQISKSNTQSVFAPVFRTNYWDEENMSLRKLENDTYTTNYFSWTGLFPNTESATPTFKLFYQLSGILYNNPSDERIKRLMIPYLEFVREFLLSNPFNQPPTRIKEDGTVTADIYHVGNAALIGKCALFCNISGLSFITTTDIITRCYKFIKSQYISSGVMKGSFALNQASIQGASNYKEYESIWHFEVIDFLSRLLTLRNFLNLSFDTPIGVFPILPNPILQEIKTAEFYADVLEMSDGNEQRIQLQNQPFGEEITISYSQMRQNDVATLMAFWDSINGTGGYFTFPDNSKYYEVISGIWQIKEPPSIEPLTFNQVRGRFKVQVSAIRVK